MTLIAAYRSVPPTDGAVVLREALAAGVDAVTVASSNTVRYLWDMADPRSRETLRTLPFISIGPITTQACRRLALQVAAEARPPGIETLADAVNTWCTTLK